MFSYITLALATASSVSGLVLPRTRYVVPSTYGSQLEPYDVYHERYMAIGCAGKQGSAFFDQCCHPLLKTQKLEQARPAQCIPGASSAAVSATSAAPSASATSGFDDGWCYEGDEGCECEDEDPEDEDCDDDEPVSSSAPAPTSSVNPTTSAKPTTSPKPSSTPKPTPTPTPTTTPAATTKPATSTKPASTPKPTTSASSGSPSTELFTNGKATFYYQGGAAGACGTVHADSDLIAALSGPFYGDFNARSSNCGRKVRVTRKSTGKFVDVVVADACPTCADKQIDLSTGAFFQLGTEAEGEIDVDTVFLS